MHACELGHGWTRQVNVERLTLVDEGTLKPYPHQSHLSLSRDLNTHSIRRQIDNSLLRDFPDSLVDRLQVRWHARNCCDKVELVSPPSAEMQARRCQVDALF